MTSIRNAVVVAGAAIACAVTTTGAAGATASASASVPHRGSVSFVIGGDTNHPIVLVHGAINTAGKDDPNHNNFDVLNFAHGSMRIVHPESQAKFVPKIDKKTCYASFTESGKFTLSHGTGRFAGIAGAGRYSAHGYAYLPRTRAGVCNQNAKPSHEIFTVQAHGTLK
jgi:hypothetical protein